ncbi:MAG: hydroxyacid dehydrogenase [Bacteroidetes bacterium GWF2_33_16]|nr:MAG: hydroxyacid dehydrogenase [Bacteroidetes bacterium GWE2_32_14]OFY08585.1 MAG: hydroxyacid dehydrogenase [Bacteroidetes bacterium GWF2_33_16]
MEKKFKILFLDTTHPRLPEMLINAGFECHNSFKSSVNEIKEIISNYKGIILRSRIKIDKTLMDEGVNLKFIGRVGAGLENIDTEYAEKKGIQCINSPEGNRDAVGEHALGMLLCLLNNITKANSEVREGIWLREENRGLEIKGKTIGIIGYGNMGTAFAQRLKGFGANVIAYDKYKSNYSDDFVTERQLVDLFEQSDILSLHVPLTEETHYMVNNEFINQFKKDIYIINTARGKVLNTDDLVLNMKKGKVLGAVLDVLEYEKASLEGLNYETEIPESLKYLIQSKNTILTPHIAGWTKESNIKLSEILAEKIINAFGKQTTE